MQVPKWEFLFVSVRLGLSMYAYLRHQITIFFKYKLLEGKILFYY